MESSYFKPTLWRDASAVLACQEVRDNSARCIILGGDHNIQLDSVVAVAKAIDQWLGPQEAFETRSGVRKFVEALPFPAVVSNLGHAPLGSSET